MFRPLLLAALAFLPQVATAQTSEDEHMWVNLTATGPISGDIVYFAEIQPRIGDGVSRVDQLLLRGAVGVKLSPALTLSQGYAHVVTPQRGGRDINEERSFQQIAWNIGKPLGVELSSRTRFEQRWRNDGDDMGLRLREMLRFEKPLQKGPGPSALIWSEVFVALNDTDWGARSGFVRKRNCAGVELPVGGASTVELGYMNEYIDQAAGRSRMHHIASISLFFRH